MLRTFFRVVRVLCERGSDMRPHTTVTLEFGKEGNWRVDRGWYHVKDVVIEYLGPPFHSIGDEFLDIDCHMRKLLDLDGDPAAEK